MIENTRSGLSTQPCVPLQRDTPSSCGQGPQMQHGAMMGWEQGPQRWGV